ncbi:mitochondrial substrate carrier family protein G-like [Acropora millepora]|uniref:mitochondrial substrate carrier family protein G-like n=1 Tax=Acropora millepora TaxID=45264 RepID=UPI0010FC8178|nr:mitochondrial substrate carrier family protein G-like [Acropora millepora]
MMTHQDIMAESEGKAGIAISSGEHSFVRRTVKNVVSGTFSGIAVCLVGHPFDTLKVRLQTQPIDRPVYTGLLDCFVKTMKWEGIGGLYKGVGSPIVGQMFFRATLFTSYYQITAFFAGKDRQGQRLTVPEYFLSGMFTGFFAALVEGPIDLFKSKMQIQIIRAKSGEPVMYRNVFHAAYVIVKKHGIRGAYQGLPATWLRNIPANSAFFGFYELSRTMATPKGGTVQDLSPFALLAAGGTGGFLYWFLTYPTDVIKSSMQADDSTVEKRRFKSIRDCARQLHNEGGWKRFYTGFTPCLLRSIPANATLFFVVETIRKHFPL